MILSTLLLARDRAVVFGPCLCWAQVISEYERVGPVDAQAPAQPFTTGSV